MDLKNGDCLELLKDIPDKTVDLIFADLPYGQVNCKWDSKIDLELLWKELIRISRSQSTPMFFTCTTKFGYELIKSNEKMFKYDLVWVKSAPCGFLQAKKQPMRKHEMIYVFYKKQPLYDLSSHTHKFKKEERKKVEKNSNKGGLYSEIERLEDVKYDPPLPTSVIKYDIVYEKDLYGVKRDDRKNKKIYDPPLPTSVIKEDKVYGKVVVKTPDGRDNNRDSIYDPPLPTSVLEIKSTKLKTHSTAKPPDLMKWILKYYSKEGDTVLDPTMGSNPMGLACKEMNRNYIGIEKDPEIFKYACERVDYII